MQVHLNKKWLKSYVIKETFPGKEGFWAVGTQKPQSQCPRLKGVQKCSASDQHRSLERFLTLALARLHQALTRRGAERASSGVGAAASLPRPKRLPG